MTSQRISPPRTRLLAAIVALAVTAAACTDSAETSTTETNGSATTNTDGSTQQVVATPGTFLDESVIHTISVEFDQSAYEAMLATYASTGDKEWIEATVAIDGNEYPRVGIRLKGNSSLRGLGGGGPGGDSASGDSPESIPWLIRLDRNVEGQDHDGLTEIVVRSNSSATALNEAVALDLLEEAGLASQESAYAAFSVNGSEAALRLVMENPNDVWMEGAFDSAGILYKAEAGGDYSYRGDDPASYDEVFDIEAGEDNGDLTPLIEFLDFINNADDATFNAELAGHLDVESFADYLALEDLIDNFDDIDGPGNNSYLFYDTTNGQFTVVPWDHNLAFGGGPVQGGGGMGSNFTPPDGGNFTPPDGGLPGGGQRPGNDQMPGGGDFQPGGIRGGSNLLVSRFLANPAWQTLYDEATAWLQADLFDSGDAQATLDKWVTVLESASDLVDSDTVTSEASSIESRF